MKKYLVIATVASTLALSSIPLNSSPTLAASIPAPMLENTGNSSYQAENINTIETETNRIASVNLNNEKHTADYNKVTGIMKITVTNLINNSIVSTSIIDTNEKANQLGTTNENIKPIGQVGGISTLATKELLQKEQTFTNYEYFKYSNKTWEIRRPKPKTLDGYYYKNVKESTGDNKNKLSKFKAQVESINTLEFTVITQIGAGAIGILITAFVPGAQVASGLALTALGYSATSYPALHKLMNKMEDAYATYKEIK